MWWRALSLKHIRNGSEESDVGRREAYIARAEFTYTELYVDSQCSILISHCQEMRTDWNSPGSEKWPSRTCRGLRNTSKGNKHVSCARVERNTHSYKLCNLYNPVLPQLRMCDGYRGKGLRRGQSAVDGVDGKSSNKVVRPARDSIGRINAQCYILGKTYCIKPVISLCNAHESATVMQISTIEAVSGCNTAMTYEHSFQ